MSFLRVKDHVSLFVPSFISMFILRKFFCRKDKIANHSTLLFPETNYGTLLFPEPNYGTLLFPETNYGTLVFPEIITLPATKWLCTEEKAILLPNNSDLCPAKCKQGDFLHIWYFVIIIKFVCFPMITIIHHQSSHTSVYKKKLNIYCDCTFIRGVKQHNEKL